ncbi:hypothetical protein [Planktothrix agardhii]|jgi:hypothetical protein|uniref:hypothetical protein n=1 Tax=Planktothrix agardhii TaxID=1160 RepID=UPI0028A871DF|nr:hypothetical protein [Planktothrix agardhii]
MNNLLQEAIKKVESLSESEQEKIALLIIEQIKKTEDKNALDEWDLIIQECQINTGITDLAYQHDHYIHGTPKKENKRVLSKLKNIKIQAQENFAENYVN